MARTNLEISVTGLKELEDALKELGDDSTKIGRAALRKSANEMRDALIAGAPRSARINTGRVRVTKRKGRVGYDAGHLFENIRVTEQRTHRNHLLVMGVHVGKAFWGAFLEFGTRHMPARPWMRPVFDAKAPGMVPYLEAELKKRIERKARQLARKAAKAGK